MQSIQVDELLHEEHWDKHGLQFEVEPARAVVLKYPFLHLQPTVPDGSEFESLHIVHE